MMTVQKSIAIFLSFCFLATQSLCPSWAAPSLAGPLPVPLRANGGEFSVPGDLGHLKIYGDGHGPVIFHVLTAHGQYEAQKNIEAILFHLKKNYGIDGLLVEGSAERLDPARLNLLPENPSLAARALDLLAQRAFVKGVELFLNKEPGVPAFGIEDSEAYRDNRQSLRNVLAQSSMSESFIKKLDQAIVRNIDSIRDAGFRDFLRDRLNYDSGTLDLAGYLELLKKTARELWKIDLGEARHQREWPMLVRYFKLRKFAGILGAPWAQEESRAFLADLARSGARRSTQVRTLLEARPGTPELQGPEVSASFERWMEEERTGLERYPAAKYLIGERILRSEVDAGTLGREVKKLSLKIEEAFTGSRKDQERLFLLHDLQSLRRLLRMELVPEDDEAVLAYVEDLAPSRLFARAGISAKKSALKDWDGLFANALRFYRDARSRDRYLAYHALQTIRQQKFHAPVMITGGFHAESLRQKFTGEGFRVVQIEPAIRDLEALKKGTGLRDYFLHFMPTALAAVRHSTVEEQFFSDPRFGRYDRIFDLSALWQSTLAALRPLWLDPVVSSRDRAVLKNRLGALFHVYIAAPGTLVFPGARSELRTSPPTSAPEKDQSASRVNKRPSLWRWLRLWWQYGRKLGPLSFQDWFTLQASEIKFREMWKRSGDGFELTDENGRYLDVNEATLKQLGYTRKEMLALTISDIDPQVGLGDYQDTFNKLKKDGGSITFESTHRRKDGSVFPVEITTSVIEIGGSYRAVAQVRDITARKQAEEALKESEERFRQVAENAEEWIWEVDLNGMYTYSNPACEKIIGYKPEEIVGKMHFFDFFTPNDREVLKESTLKGLREGRHTRRLLNRNLHKDGHVVILETNGLPVIRDGKVVAYRGVDTDLTREEEAKADLLLKEQVFEVSIASNIIMDLEGNVTEANPAFLRLWGYSDKSKVLGTFVGTFFKYREEMERVRDVLRAQGRWEGRFRARKADGTPFIAYGLAVVLRDIHGHPVGYQSSAVDITEQVRVEMERDMEQRFNAEVLSRVGALVVVMDRQGRIVRFNETCQRLTGYSLEDLESPAFKGKALWEFLLPSKEVPSVREVFERLKAGDFPVSFTNRWMTKTGQGIPIEWTNTVLTDPQGEVEYVIGIGIDLRKRMRAQEALKASEQRFRSIVASSPIGMHFYRLLQNGRLVLTGFNPAADRILNIVHQPLVGKTVEAAFPGLVGTGIPERYAAVARGEEGACTFEAPYEHDGIRGIYNVTVFKTGLNMIAVKFMDVSEQKSAEEELRQKTALLESQMEASPDGILVVDAQGRRILMNKKFGEMFQAPQTILADPDHQAFYNFAKQKMKDPDAFDARVRHLYDHPTETSFDLVEFRDGRVFRRYSSPILGKNGAYFGRIWTFRDVTERTRNERFERLQFDITARFAKAGPEEIEDVLRDLLRWMGEFFGVEHDTIFLINPDGKTFHLSHEWLSPDTSIGRFPPIGDLPLADYPSVTRQLLEGNAIIIPDLDRVAGKFMPLVRGWKQRGVRARVNVPISYGGRLIGQLGLSASQPRDWTEDEVLKLRTLGHLLSELLHRVDLEKRVLESERRLQATLEAAGVIAWGFEIEKGPHGALQYRHYEDGPVASIFGRPAGFNHSGMDDLASSIHPEDRDHVVRSLEDCLKGNKDVYKVEYRVIQEDGSVRWIAANGTLQRDVEGRPLRLLGVARNVTQRKQMEDALRQSEEHFRTLFTNASVGIALIGPDFNFLDSNGAFLHLFGYSEDEMLQKKISDLTHPDDLESTSREFQRLIAGEADAISMDKRCLKKNGKIVPVHVSISLVRNEQGDVRHFIVMIEDIAARKAAEAQTRQLEKAKRDVEEAVKIQNLISRVAHDLNNLLAASKGYPSLLLINIQKFNKLVVTLAQTLQQAEQAPGLSPAVANALGKISEVFLEWVQLQQALVNGLNAIHDSADAMEARLGPLMIFAGISHGKAEVFPLTPVLRSLVEQNRQRFRNVRFSLQEDDPVKIEGNRRAVMNLFSNLLVNAAQAIPTSVQGRVQVTVERVVLDTLPKSLTPDWGPLAPGEFHPGPYARISVEDGGGGIAPEVLSSLFQPFFTTKGDKGTGLGLAAVEQVVRDHHGILDLRSEPGQGTTFVVYLPATEKPLEEEAIDPEVFRGTETIWLLEDEKLVADMIQTGLEQLGYRVFHFATESEILAAAWRAEKERTGLPAFVVLDMEIQGRPKGGINAYRGLKQKLGTLPGIMISGKVSGEIVQQGYQLGLKHFLSKPLEILDLARIIREELDEARSRRLAGTATSDESPQKVQSAPQPPLRILIVEDDPSVLPLLKDVFDMIEPEASVVFAEDHGAVEAVLQKVSKREQSFDLVLLDQNMSGMDPVIVAEQLNQQADLKPAIVVNSGKPPQPELSGKIHSALMKPVSVGDLRKKVAEVKTWLAQQRAEAQREEVKRSELRAVSSEIPEPGIGASLWQMIMEKAGLREGVLPWPWQEHRPALFNRMMQALFPAQDASKDSRQIASARSILAEIGADRRIAVPFVHIADWRNEAAVLQILDAARLFVEQNSSGAYRVLLAVDRESDRQGMQEFLDRWVRAQYPHDLRKQNTLWSRLKVAVGQDATGIARWVPGLARTVWVDWMGETETRAEVPARARDLQVIGNRLADGTLLSFDNKNKGYAVSFLQAVTLLLRGPSESQLQRSAHGPAYVQQSLAAFRDFLQVFTAMRALSSAA